MPSLLKAANNTLVVLLLISLFSFSAAIAEESDDEEKGYNVIQEKVLTPDKRRIFSPNIEKAPPQQHTLFIKCDNWLGCYMPCKGTLQSCLDIAARANWTVLHVITEDDKAYKESNIYGGPVSVPKRPN